MNVTTELARLMGQFSPAAVPASALSGEQAGGSFSPTDATPTTTEDAGRGVGLDSQEHAQ